MYIKDQTFKDEETLLEMLFDFSLGNPSPYTQEIITVINTELENNEAYIKYRNSLTDEDDRVELYTEERDLRLAENLLKRFESFAVRQAKLYGIDKAEKTLLYEIDLY